MIPTSKTSKSVNQEPPEAQAEARPTQKLGASTASSKDMNSPIKEKSTKEKDYDEEPPPSVPSLVQPRKLYDSMDESDSDDSGGGYTS